MEIIDELSKQKNALSSAEYRMLDAIDAGKYKLSIQGSNGHYCSPRDTINPLYYSDMELAIFKGDKWVNPNRDKKIKAFPRYSELMERCDGVSKYTVYGYAPVELLNDLYLYLKG